MSSKTVHKSVVISALGFCLACGQAFAERHPHVRNGFYLGVGVGFGNAGADVSVVDDLDRESGGTGSFRAGWAFRNDLAVGLESTAWTRRFEGDVVDQLSWTFSITSLSLIYFVRDSGAFVRGGVGVGTSSVELEHAGGTLASEVELGVGFAVAAGYEWRVTKNLAVAPQFEFAYLDIGGEITSHVDFVSVSVQATWYW